MDQQQQPRDDNDKKPDKRPLPSAVSLTNLRRDEDDESTQEVPVAPVAAVAASTTTNNKTTPDNKTATMLALCVCMFTHSYLLISVFPYSGYLAMHLLLAVNADTVGPYAGLLAASFMAGRAATSVAWGRAADRVGRVTVLLASLALSGVFSLGFGMASHFWAALVLRLALGLSNGIMSAMKTIVSESAKDQASEARHMSIVIGMWGAGFLLSPVLSGALAEPHRQYPNQEWLQQGWIGAVLEEYPFLLPNLLGALFCGVAIVAVQQCVVETLPADKQVSLATYLCPNWRRDANLLSLFPSTCPYTPIPNSGGSGETTATTDRVSMKTIWSRTPTRRCLIIYWVYSFCGLTIDESFPLFLLNPTAGLGLAEVQIGKILSLTGLVFVTLQYPLYQYFYQRFGLLGSVRKAALLATPSLFCMPLSVVLQHDQTGRLPWSVWAYLGTCMAVYRIMAYVFFTSISVAINRTVPTTERATMNGLSLLGGSIAKALGPAFAGILCTVSISWWGSYGSLLIFGTIGMLVAGVMVATYTYLPAELVKQVQDDDPPPHDDESQQSDCDVEVTRQRKMERQTSSSSSPEEDSERVSLVERKV